jgi:hypothetical protein
MRTGFIVLVFAFVLQFVPARAQQACATMPTLQACISCGAAKYGLGAQTAHCKANWRPGAKPRRWSEKDEERAQRLIKEGR